MSRVATSQLQGPRFGSVYIEFLCLIVSSCGFPPGSPAPPKNLLARWIGYSKLLLGVNEFLNACVPVVIPLLKTKCQIFLSL